MQDITTIKRAFTPIAKEYGLKRAYIFGSYARGEAREDSDVDLLIEKGKPLSLIMLSSLLQDARAALGLPVDLVTTAGIDEDFRRSISGTEVLIYEGE